MSAPCGSCWGWVQRWPQWCGVGMAGTGTEGQTEGRRGRSRRAGSSVLEEEEEAVGSRTPERTAVCMSCRAHGTVRRRSANRTQLWLFFPISSVPSSRGSFFFILFLFLFQTISIKIIIIKDLLEALFIFWFTGVYCKYFFLLVVFCCFFFYNILPQKGLCARARGQWAARVPAITESSTTAPSGCN